MTVVGICMLLLSHLSLKGSELPVLTLESAITSAKTYSTTLSQIRRSQTLNSAKLNQAVSEGSYKSYQKQYLENQYTDKQEEIQEKIIAYEVSKLFDEILLNEAKLKDTQDSLRSHQSNIENAKLKHQKGLISQSELDKMLLEFETAQSNKQQFENTITSQYTTLCEMMGKRTTRFILEKEAIIYEPYEIIGSLDGVISSKAEQNLSVWKAIESAKIESEIDYSDLEKSGNSYVAYLQLQESTVKAQETSESTKQQFENTLRSKYAELLQLQEKYKLQKKELASLEKELETKGIHYYKGYISKTAYETLKFTYQQAKTNLLETIVKQEYMKQVIENPYLL